MAYNRIEIPPLVRDPLPWNLLAVAKDVTPEHSRWTSGVAWESGVVDPPKSWDPQADEPVEKDLTYASADNGEAAVAIIYMPYACPVYGEPTDEDVAMAKARLEAGTAYGVESVFWTWASAVATPSAATGTPAEVVGHMASLLAEDLSGKGIFHMPSWAAEIYRASAGYVDKPTTARGDDIVFGAGYPHSGGTLGDAETILATGPVGYLLSSIEVYESNAFVAQENRRVLVAERYVALQVDADPIVSGALTVPA